MKFPLVLLTALLLQRGNASAQPFDLSQVVEKITNIPRLASDGFTEYASVKRAQNFAERVHYETERKFEHFEEMTQKMDESLHKLVNENIQIFQTFVQIFNRNLGSHIFRLRNKVKRNAMKDVKEQLESINASVETLKQTNNGIADKINEDIDRNEDNFLSEWNKFASDQLEIVANATNDKATNELAEQIVNTFVNRYGTFINACSEEFQQTAEKYRDEVNAVIKANQAVVESLLEEVNMCLAKDNSRRSARKCQADVKKQLPKLANVPSELSRLNKQGSELLDNGFTKSACVVNTLTEFEQEKQHICKQLQDITKNNPTRTPGTIAAQSP